MITGRNAGTKTARFRLAIEYMCNGTVIRLTANQIPSVSGASARDLEHSTPFDTKYFLEIGANGLATLERGDHRETEEHPYLIFKLYDTGGDENLSLLCKKLTSGRATSKEIRDALLAATEIAMERAANSFMNPESKFYHSVDVARMMADSIYLRIDIENHPFIVQQRSDIRT